MDEKNQRRCHSVGQFTTHEEIFHNRYNSSSDSDPEIDSLNMGEHSGSYAEGEDEESVVTVNAAHDQGHHYSQSNHQSSPNTIRQTLTAPETPPTLTKQSKFKDHGKSKPKSSRQTFLIHGPTRLRNIIGEYSTVIKFHIFFRTLCPTSPTTTPI